MTDPSIPAASSFDSTTSHLPASAAHSAPEFDVNAPAPSAPKSTTDTAKEQAADVKDTAAQAGGQVAQVAKDQAANVASEAKSQASNLLGQAKSEVSSQTSTQQQRAAGGLKSISEELHQMAQNSQNGGPAASVTKQAAERIGTAAQWLENREPAEVLQEVKRFAQQRPGLFLAIAAGAGLVAGRLARGLSTDPDEVQAKQASSYSTDRSAYISAQPPVNELPAYGQTTYPTGEYAQPTGVDAALNRLDASAPATMNPDLSERR